MLKPKILKLSMVSLSTLFFIACGGGSDTSSSEKNSEITEEVVLNLTPIANAGLDQNISFGLPIKLNAKDSLDSDGKIVEYTWYLNDEVIGREKSIALTIPKEGTYSYRLVVTDDKNATASDRVEVRTYTDTIVKLKTNQGDIYLKMMSDIAPNAVENFTIHSENGYYDGVNFHRVIKDFMIQAGDPTGTGNGGESIWGGYFSNEIDSTVLFNRPFLLGMANAGGSKTNGSQFFITTKAYPSLDGKYTIFGEVIEGKETVSKIEKVETVRSKPKNSQTILKAMVYFK